MEYKDLLRQAYRASQYSHDYSTQLAAIIFDEETNSVLNCACNCFPAMKYVNNLTYQERPLKYSYIEHAERNVLFACAREGQSTNGKTMICPWACCADCARAIVLAGISKVVIHQATLDQSPDRWLEPVKIGHEILAEGGVELVRFEGQVGKCRNLFNGEFWEP